MQYSKEVMDHFMNPRNVGQLENPTASGEVGNPVCGDIMKIDLLIKDNVITDAKFQTFGCGSAIATSSIATEMIIGQSVFEALDLTNRAVAEALSGLPAVKMHCSVLAEQAIKTALKQFLEDTKQMKPEYAPKFKILEEEDEHHEHDGPGAYKRLEIRPKSPN